MKKKSRKFATSEFCVFDRFFGKQHCWVLRLILKSILIKCFIKKKIWSALRIKHKSVHTKIYMLLCFVMYRYILNRIDPVFRILKITIQPFIFSFLQQPDFKIYIYDNFYSKFSDWKSPLPSFSLCARKVR